jgi:hypothetical protein
MPCFRTHAEAMHCLMTEVTSALQNFSLCQPSVTACATLHMHSKGRNAHGLHLVRGKLCTQLTSLVAQATSSLKRPLNPCCASLKSKAGVQPLCNHFHRTCLHPRHSESRVSLFSDIQLQRFTRHLSRHNCHQHTQQTVLSMGLNHNTWQAA